MGKVIVVFIDILGKFGSGSIYVVYKGVLEIMFSLVVLKGELFGFVFKELCCIFSVVFIVNKLNELSVVVKLVEVVYSELIFFSRKFQDQKYNGFK